MNSLRARGLTLRPAQMTAIDLCGSRLWPCPRRQEPYPDSEMLHRTRPTGRLTLISAPKAGSEGMHWDQRRTQHVSHRPAGPLYE